jgi:ArsR family transcriptional regulator, arsenate/arsenite/antimonite-responsive transcriptional repressor
MEMMDAVPMLGALAHETRLGIFRLLVRRGFSGMAAGEVAGKLSLPPATASFHLAFLKRAGLLVARRESRNIYYAADFKNMTALISYLQENCCVDDQPLIQIERKKPGGKR